MTDEQRSDCIGYVNGDVHTPHLNKLKTNCINFENAFTTNPSCIPARAAIFTGKYPSQCGTPTYITPLANTETTFMTTLKQSGYYTSVIGKQHFADSTVSHGYDYEDIIDGHFPNFKKKNSYTDFLIREGFCSEDELTVDDDRFTKKWISKDIYHIDGYIGSRGVEWIKTKSTKLDNPWYFCLSFPGPHMPFDGIGLSTERFYTENDISVPKTMQKDLKQKPAYYYEQLHLGKGNPGILPVINATEAHIKHTRKSYYANMSLIDQKIGEVIDMLKTTNQYDNTVIFFTSDHGDYMGDFGMFGKGQYLSEVLMKIPFFVKPPIKDFDGYTETDFAFNFDIAPTCLDLANIKIPNDMSAQNLTPYWNTLKSKNPLEYAYFEAGNIRSIRTKKWKLIFYMDKEYGELYDIENDCGERINLWDSSDFCCIKHRLIIKLCNKMISLGRLSYSPWNYNAPVF